MTLYEWSPDYSTGIRVIDNDHKDLFEAINTFHNALQTGTGADQVAATIDCLIRYVDEHFEREECFLERANYPELESHRHAHADFAGMIRMVHKIYSEDPQAVNGPKVLDFLSDWLTQHILKIDMKYVPFMKGDELESEEKKEIDQVPAMTTVQVPEDATSLVQELVKIISAGGGNKTVLEETVRRLGGQRDQAMLERAKKLFCEP